jgi:hypothetical protein
MNRTDQFSDLDIEQGILNMEAVRNLCKLIRDGMQTRDPMRLHFTEVIKFLNSQIAASNKLLTGRKIEVVQ